MSVGSTLSDNSHLYSTLPFSKALLHLSLYLIVTTYETCSSDIYICILQIRKPGQWGWITHLDVVVNKWYTSFSEASRKICKYIKQLLTWHWRRTLVFCQSNKVRNKRSLTWQSACFTSLIVIAQRGVPKCPVYKTLLKLASISQCKMDIQPKIDAPKLNLLSNFRSVFRYTRLLLDRRTRDQMTIPKDITKKHEFYNSGWK